MSALAIRSAVTPVHIDNANLGRLASEFKVPGKKVIATSAALIHDKDPLTMIRAVAELARIRLDFTFVHFGAGGNNEEAARAFTAIILNGIRK